MTRDYLRRVSVVALTLTTAMYPAEALANPIALGGFIINAAIGALPTLSTAGLALSAASLSTGFLAVVGGVAIVGAGLALSALTGSQPGSIDPGKAKEEIATEATSEVNAIGTVRLAGAVAYGNNKHPDMYRLLLHCKGPLNAILATYVNGREVVVDDQSRVISSPWSKVNSTNGNIQDNWLRLFTKVGDGNETAWSELITAFPDVWTANHRARGIFQTLVRAENPGTATDRYRRLYAAAVYPKIEQVAQIGLIYDPRKDDTVTGGSGTHRADDPSTWEWTDNGVLGCAHIMLDYPDITAANFDWELQAAEATKADALVTTKTGTERRSRISGVWPSMNNRGATMQQALDSAGAEVRITADDKIYIALIEDNPAAEITFDEDTIKVVNWQSGPEAVDRPNTCRIRYYSPEREYEMTEIDLTGIGWAVVQDEVDRWGEKILELDFPFCFSASQAQRIGRRMFTKARADRGEIITSMFGVAARGCHYADIELFTDVDRCYIDGNRAYVARGEVSIPFVKAETLAAWSPATDEADAPARRSPQLDDTDLAQPAAPSAAFWIRYGDGTKEARVTFANDVSGSDGYLCVYQTFANDIPQVSNLMQEFSNNVNVARSQVDLEGQKVQFRRQAYDDDAASEFSDPLIVESLSPNTDAALAISNVNVSKRNDGIGGADDFVVEINFRVETPNLIALLVEYDLDETGSFTTLLNNTQAGPRNYDLEDSQGSSGFDDVRLRVTQTVHGGGTLVYNQLFVGV